MPAFREALDRLAQLEPAGIAAHFAVDAVPDDLNRGQLPALLVLPVRIEDEAGGLFGERGGSFEAVAFSEGPRTATIRLTHLLLVAPLAAGSGQRAHLPLLVDRIDAVLTALAGEVTLGGLLVEPLRVRVEPGIYTYGGVEYLGCAFRHTWTLDIAAPLQPQE